MLIRENATLGKTSLQPFSDIDLRYIGTSQTKLEHLTKNSAQGDAIAFTELYNLFRPIIRHLTRRFEPVCPYDGDDLVQEIFLKLWEKRDQLEDIRDFHRYLCLMVRNRLTDQFRRRNCHRILISKLAAAGETVELPHQTEIQQIYSQAVSALPIRARQAYELQRTVGLKREQIAHVMGLSVHSVRNHLARAQDYVKKEITNYVLN